MSRTINVVRLTKTAIVPTQGSKEAAGWDLYADEEMSIALHEVRSISTGIAIEIPKGHAGFVCSRSGLAKIGAFVINAPGVIDSDYRGEVKVLMTFLGPSWYTVRPGDRIAQLLVVPTASFDWHEVGNLSKTDRGENGFGSTGK